MLFRSRLHGRRLGPQVDGANRADFFADTGGVVICQSDDAAAVSQWCLNWNTMLDFEIGIVLDDAETRAIGLARSQAS